MSAPFAQAWAVLKADAYINTLPAEFDTQRAAEGGFHDSTGGFISSLPRYQEPRPDGPNYRRGGSIPRNWDEKHGNQRFTGVNVAAQWQVLRDAYPHATDEELQNKFAQSFAIASAHENVHGLTDEEISEWAAHAVGGFPSNLARTEAWIPTGRADDYQTIRSLAHEYGAYTATDPQIKEKTMKRYRLLAPYVTGEKDPADLHDNRPLSRETLEALHEFKRYASPN